MYLEQLHIECFGSLSDFTLTLTAGLTVIEGQNESGKSTVCDFIRFLFYGFSDKDDRTRHLSWETGTAGGFAICILPDGGRYRVERSVTGTAARSREEKAVVDMVTGLRCFTDREPWEVFLGVTEDVFIRTAFVRQIDGGRFDCGKLSEAVENILFGADESVNTARVLKKLDETRVTLLYKNKKGGRIFDLQDQRNDLAARFEQAGRENAAIIEKEGQLADTEKKLRQNRERFEQLDRMIERAENARLAAAYDRAAAERAALDAAETSARTRLEGASFEGFFPDDAYIEELDQTAAALDETDRRLTAAGETLAVRRREASDGLSAASAAVADPEAIAAAIEEDGGGSRVLGLMTEAIGRRKTVRAAGIAGAVIGVLLLIAAAVFPGLGLIGYAAGGLFAAVGLALLIVSFLPASFEGRIFARYGVSDRTELEQLLDAVTRACEKKRLTDGALEEAAQVLAELSAARVAQSDALAALLGRWGKTDAAEAIRTYRALTEAAEEDEREAERARSTLAALEETLRGTDEAAVRARLEELGGAPEEDAADLTAVKNERRFLAEAGEALTERRHLLETELAALNASVEKPAGLYARLKQTEAEIASLTERYDAVALAYEKLTEAGDSLRDSLSPRLSEAAGGYMASLTDGRYPRVGVGHDFEMEYESSGAAGLHNRPVTALSTGTQDLVYLSLRLALMTVVFGHESVGAPPLVFDESFARLDDGRLASALALLRRRSEQQQILVFTCQKRERDALDGEAAIITMPHRAALSGEENGEDRT